MPSWEQAYSACHTLSDGWRRMVEKMGKEDDLMGESDIDALQCLGAGEGWNMGTVGDLEEKK